MSRQSDLASLSARATRADEAAAATRDRIEHPRPGDFTPAQLRVQLASHRNDARQCRDIADAIRSGEVPSEAAYWRGN
jgi:hypothetical protein